MDLISDTDLRKKLSFNFGDSCPTYTVEFVDDWTGGVTACGQKLVHVYANGAGWVANTVVDDAGKAK